MKMSDARKGGAWEPGWYKAEIQGELTAATAGTGTRQAKAVLIVLDKTANIDTYFNSKGFFRVCQLVDATAKKPLDEDADVEWNLEDTSDGEEIELTVMGRPYHLDGRQLDIRLERQKNPKDGREYTRVQEFARLGTETAKAEVATEREEIAF